MCKGSMHACVIFLIFVALRFVFNGRFPDDPTTLAMKHAGIYGYVMGGVACIFAGAMAWLWWESIRLERSRRELQRLKHLLVQIESENRL